MDRKTKVAYRQLLLEPLAETVHQTLPIGKTTPYVNLVKMNNKVNSWHYRPLKLHKQLYILDYLTRIATAFAALPSV